jgi:hypothetical protein
MPVGPGVAIRRKVQSAKRGCYAGFKLRWRFEDEAVYRVDVSTWLRYTVFVSREDETSAAWVNSRMEEGPLVGRYYGSDRIAMLAGMRSLHSGAPMT